MSRVWLTSNSQPRPLITVHLDVDEGTTVRGLCCLGCHAETTARYGMATPVAMYVASIECQECQEEFVAFEAFEHYRMGFDGRSWRAA